MNLKKVFKISHFTTIQTKFFEVDTLKNSLKSMGYEICDDTVVEGYGNITTDVNFAIRTKNGRLIGFRKSVDGYQIITDWYSVGIRQDLFMRDLNQSYSKSIVIREAMRKGFRNVSELRMEDGTIKLELRR